MDPNECKLPDLSSLDYPLIKYLIAELLIGESGLNIKERKYRRNFIRLIDKTIFEYQEARSAIISEIEEKYRPTEELMREGQKLFFLVFINHFENCINSVNRINKLIYRLKKEPLFRKVPELSVKLVDAYGKSIPSIRNAIEHMDELIQRDEISNGESVMISLGKNGDLAIIGKLTIRFIDLATVITNQHKIAVALLKKEKEDLI